MTPRSINRPSLTRGSRAGGATLDSLVDEHLVQAGPHRRYRLHDLLREYANELADGDSGRDQPYKTCCGGFWQLLPARPEF